MIICWLNTARTDIGRSDLTHVEQLFDFITPDNNNVNALGRRKKKIKPNAALSEIKNEPLMDASSDNSNL